MKDIEEPPSIEADTTVVIVWPCLRVTWQAFYDGLFFCSSTGEKKVDESFANAVIEG